MSGSVPTSIFEAEPDSVLNRTYNGDWSYTRDAEGRACVNTDPAHWQLILNWLSFGSVPQHPSAAFMAECRYWQLSRLLAQLDERIITGQQEVLPEDGMYDLTLSQVTRGNRAGFSVCGGIEPATPRPHPHSDGEIEIGFHAFGLDWELRLGRSGQFLTILSGSDDFNADVEISFGSEPVLYTPHKACCRIRRFLGTKGGWLVPSQGCEDWLTPQTAYEAVQSLPFVGLKGRVQFTMVVLFASRKVNLS